MRAFIIVFALGAAGCHDRADGERCNPLQYSQNGARGDCREGLACVYPTAPSCGVAYCCKLDETGHIADEEAACQRDPSLDAICGLDLSVTDAQGEGD